MNALATTALTPVAAHAVYAPSSAHRWIYCSASAEAISYLPPQEEEEGSASAIGTEAHDEIDRILGPYGGDGFGFWLEHPNTMIEPIDYYHHAAFGIALVIDFVRHLPPGVLWIEQRVRLTDQIWGRCDVCHWDETTGILTIIDYKNGMRAVDAEENEQLRIYAAGSMFTHHLPVEFIRYVVVQPNDWRPFVPRVKQWHEPVAALYAWATHVATIPTGPKTFEAGEHCRDCPLFGHCPASTDAISNVAALIRGLVQPAEVRPEQVAMFLAMAKPIEDAFKSFRKFHEKKALKASVAPPAMRLVETVKHRAWIDAPAAKKAFAEKFGALALDLPTVAQAEALGFDVGPYSDKPKGVPALAFEHDKRKTWVEKTGADMFASVNLEAVSQMGDVIEIRFSRGFADQCAAERIARSEWKWRGGRNAGARRKRQAITSLSTASNAIMKWSGCHELHRAGKAPDQVLCRT
jgi:hypothetical protein